MLHELIIDAPETLRSAHQFMSLLHRGDSQSYSGSYMVPSLELFFLTQRRLDGGFPPLLNETFAAF
jgi:hypothetical protein